MLFDFAINNFAEIDTKVEKGARRRAAPPDFG